MAIVMEIDEQVLAAKFDTILPHLDERQRRLLMAAEARSLGYGGIALVARAAGVSRVTVTAGVDELDGGAEPLGGRARRPGGGRKPLTCIDAGLLDALDALVEPETRGDPMTRLRWTTKSTRNLADELGNQGHQVSHHSVGKLLAGPLDYSLQGNAKTLEGRQHPDRDAQFRYIARRVTAALAAGEPVISVDAKKKELIGGTPARAANGARPVTRAALMSTISPASRARRCPTACTTWALTRLGVGGQRRRHRPVRRPDHPALVGQRRHDRLPGTASLLITADAGGSNGCRLRLWKKELAALADAAGLAITVCHMPPGTSKWNKIEHRLFSYISMNWAGQP